jgi:hypothetical protein
MDAKWLCRQPTIQGVGRPGGRNNLSLVSVQTCQKIQPTDLSYLRSGLSRYPLARASRNGLKNDLTRPDSV